MKEQILSGVATMAYGEQIFKKSYRIKLVIWAALTLFLGLGMLVWPFVVFRMLMSLLPAVLTVSGIIAAGWAFQCRRNRRPHRRYWLLAGVMLIAGILLWNFMQWRDVVLWYGFAAYLAVSGWQNMRPVWQRGVEMQPVWRMLGALTVWAFAALMLCMPSSGLSEALRLLGVFTVSWGAFQLLIPPPQE